MPKISQSRLRPFFFVLTISFIVGLILTLSQAPFSRAGSERFVYLPLIAKPVQSCHVPGQAYSSLPIIPPPSSIPAEQHPDMNLAIRGYEPTDASLKLVDYGPVTDAKAPQLDTVFADRRLPTFRRAYQRYRWDWDCGCRTDTTSPWDTTVLGMAVTPGETIHTPDSGYDIGGGNDALVLYASSQRITLHYGREDALGGYVIHIEDVCVEPGLLALYQSLNAAGRSELPALRGGQPLGRVLGSEIKAAVRDTGHFLDPRSHHDWWQNH